VSNTAHHAGARTETEMRLLEDDRMLAAFAPGHDHRPVQHRDGRNPWCNTCGLDMNRNTPSGRLG
jgi:hypothetical protein